jgi:hypothetical protein
MLKIITTLTLFLFGMLAKAQVTESRNLTAFSKVSVAHGIELLYTEKPTSSLEIETNQEATLKNIITEMHGETLKIYLKKGVELPSNEMIKVYLTAQDVQGLEAHSKAKITIIDQMHAKNMSILLDSGASLTGNIKTLGKTKVYATNETTYNGKIETDVLQGNFRGTAKINLTGNAKEAVFYTSGSALLSAKNFIAHTIGLNATGKSIAKLHAKNNITLHVTEQACASYTGFPEKIELNEEAHAYKKTDYIQSESYKKMNKTRGAAELIKQSGIIPNKKIAS